MARYPARALFFCYLAGIFAGGVLLSLPVARRTTAEPISLVDCFFTATSAVCVTGLGVRSTGNDFSLFGQAVILLLIQLGGIGIMTVTTFLMVVITGRGESLRHKITFTETLGANPVDRLHRVGLRVLGLTLTIEAVGAALLLPRFLLEDRPVLGALWRAVFTSISAFCNAGFALDDDSLSAYRGDALVNGVVCALLVLGGIGFPVLTDLGRTHRRWRKEQPTGRRLRRYWEMLHVTTKLVLLGAFFLLLGGMALILALEWDHALRGLPLGEKLWAAFFQSATTRTAGFNTIPIQDLSSATLFAMILLMLIGAGPCSTGGGIKVSTAVILILQGWHRLTGHDQVIVYRRAIPRSSIDRASMTVLLFTTFIVLGLAGILIGGETFFQTEETVSASHGFFLKAAFETVSALCTVGLSMGITADLSTWSKVCLVILMFVGRLGPISMVVAISRPVRNGRLRYASQEVLTG